jgi:multidrug resistance efflux pump
MKLASIYIFPLFQDRAVTRDDIDYIWKGIDKQDKQLKAAQKRQEIELLKKNAQLAKRVAKLEKRLAELEAATQKKLSS